MSVHCLIYIMESQFWLLPSVKFKFKKIILTYKPFYVRDNRLTEHHKSCCEGEKEEAFPGCCWSCNSALQAASPLLPWLPELLS